MYVASMPVYTGYIKLYAGCVPTVMYVTLSTDRTSGVRRLASHHQPSPLAVTLYNCTSLSQSFRNVYNSTSLATHHPRFLPPALINTLSFPATTHLPSRPSPAPNRRNFAKQIVTDSARTQASLRTRTACEAGDLLCHPLQPGLRRNVGIHKTWRGQPAVLQLNAAAE